jgi:outer membrane protein
MRQAIFSRTIALLVVAVAGSGVGVATLWAQTAAPAPAPTAAAARVGFVDIQRVLARSAAGVAAREQLEKDKAAMQKQVDGQRVELEKLRDELEKKGQLLSAEARKEKQDMLERKVRDARRLVDDLQGTLQKKEEAMLAKVLQEVSGLIQKVGKDKGFALVLERQRSSILYASADVDLTDDIIHAYDDETKKVKK